MKTRILFTLLSCLALALAADSDPKAAIPKSDRISPKAAAAALAAKGKAAKPKFIHIGFKGLYMQGHIPGTPYAGPGSNAEGLKALKAEMKGVPKGQGVILYCGCCPWGDCPNVIPAYKLLKGMGYAKVQIMEIPSNFGEDWADKGYPVGTK